MDHSRLASLADRQLGLFTRRQAAACGFSAYQIRRRIKAGEWHRVLGSVLSAAPGTRSIATMDLAANLAIPDSVLAGPSAARRWGIPMPAGERTYLYVGPHARLRLPGIRPLYETVGSTEIVLSGAARITSRRLTVVDCLRLLPEDQAVALLDGALARHEVCLADIAALIQERTGRRGIRRAVAVLRRMADGTRSAAERRAVALLRRAGITGWLANVPISGPAGVIAVGDIVFPAIRLVIEIDGWAFHATRESFQRDRERQNALIAAGWTVLRFTWRDLTERSEYVVAQIHAAIDRLSR